MTKTVVQSAWLAGLMVVGSMALTACGEHHEEVKAVDKVDEAAELARANAPEAETFEFDSADAGAVDTGVAESTEQAAADEATVAATDGSLDNVDAQMAEENAQEATDAAADGMTQTVNAEVAEAEATDAGSEPAPANQ